MTRRLLVVLGALAVVASAVVLYRFEPTDTSFYPRCVFHAMTGFDCPGCGGTRALHHLLHGRVAMAFTFNPLLFVLVPFLALGAVKGWLTRPWAGWSIATVMTAYWVVRNLPWWPW